MTQRRNSLYATSVWAFIVSSMVAWSYAQGQEMGEAEWFAPDDAPLWRVRGEYLGWWTNGNHLPPLVTTSPPGTPLAEAGVLGANGTQTLFGDRFVDTGIRSGGRITLTRWLEDWEDTGVEFVGFYLADDYQSGNFTASSAGDPILARPFFNANPLFDRQDAERVAFPGIISGSANVNSYSEIYSAAGLLRHNLAIGPTGRIDFLGGYRYLRLRETLSIRENLTSTDQTGVTGVPLGTTFNVLDRFATGNDFHGGEFGLAAEMYWSRFSVELLGKLAVGGVFRHTDINGRTIVSVPGLAPDIQSGGLLTQPTNIGSRSDRRFGVLPELGVNTRTALMPGTALIFGYSLIVLSDVLRTGDQIDRVVNSSQLGGGTLNGPARPAFTPHGSTFLVQGLNVGVDYRW